MVYLNKGMKVTKQTPLAASHYSFFPSTSLSSPKHAPGVLNTPKEETIIGAL